MSDIKIDAKAVGELRARTGGKLLDCKDALVEAKGDAEAAIVILKKKGLVSAAKKAGNQASDGLVHAYIHGVGRIGVLVELNCETDFVAKNEAFKQLAHDIAMHIVVASPLYVSREEVPQDVLQKEREIIEAQCADKPPAALQKIIEGKLEKYYQTVCLVDQTFFKNQDQTIQDLLIEKIAKTGEKIVVSRFARYQIGE
jgi:elongation factor Ts